jgi:hypothetical protein
MNQTQLAEAIKQLSQELHTIIGESLTAEGMPAVEHELIKSKCVALYDMLMKIETLPMVVAPVIPAPPAPKPEIKPEPVKPAPEPVIENSAVPPPSLFNDLPLVEEKVEAPITEPEPVASVIEKTHTEIQNEIIDEIIEIREEQKQKEMAITPPPSKETLSEISLHEKIASVLPQVDLTERFTSSLSSLKSAINVNLKIALVNDLFNENTVEYVKAIDKLNNASDINEAMRYFTELKHTYGWENDNILVKELESLIGKRFS